VSNFAERFKDSLERQKQKGSKARKYTGESQGLLASSERKQEANAPHLVAREALKQATTCSNLCFPSSRRDAESAVSPVGQTT
jgi:hypothetical protein